MISELERTMEKIWLKSYPTNVPDIINPDEYSSLVELFENNCEKYADLPAFTNFGTSITYRQLYESSRSLAAYFQQTLQLKPGDRLAIMLPNIIQSPLVIFAGLMAGLVIVNVNPLYTSFELKHQLIDSGATTIVVMENFAHTLTAVMADVPTKQVIITKVGDMLGPIKGPVISWLVKYIHRLIPKYNLVKAIQFKKALSFGASLTFNKIEQNGHDIAFLQYTGGTTGISKAAILTHRNLVANVLQSVSWVKGAITPGKEMILGALPFYHIFALTVCCFCFMNLGANCLLITNPRDLKNFLKILRKSSITVFIGVNTLFSELLNLAGIHKVDFSRLKLTIAGGMKTQRSVAEKWQQLTSVPILEGYGLTEASPIVSINPINLKEFNDSIGLPVPSTQVTIRDESCRDLSINEIGEICVKGPQVMEGYWNNPYETAKVFDADGWLHTGDLAKIDAKGFIHLLERKKDMIIVSGFNVYPNEVEDIISMLDGVKEVAIVGLPDPKTGEAVKAFVVKKDPRLTENDIMNHCRKYLTHYKLPKLIEFCKELPKSNVGKVLRRELRDRAGH